MEEILIQDESYPIEAMLWHCSKGYVENGATGPTIYCVGDAENPILNSGSFVCKSAFNRRRTTTTISDSDKDFIKFELQFLKQLHDLSEDFQDMDYRTITNEFLASLSELLRIAPTKFTLEVTPEKSVLYTLVKEDYTFFIQHFLGIQDPEDDQMIVTIFKGNSKLPSFAGDFNDVIHQVKRLLFPSLRVNSLALPYELSL